MKTLTLTSALAALLLAAPAQAETTNCTAITTLPYVISTQGVYCLTGHLSTGITSGSAITITTNNVVLDLNGFKLGGQAAGLGTTATGISADQRQNITIKNGTVRGFMYGIRFDDVSPYTTSQGHVIEDMRIDQNTYFGIYAYGRDIVIRNNAVLATGGTTVFGANAWAGGIISVGPGSQILNNQVANVNAQGTGPALGIHLTFADDAVVARNRVNNIISPAGSGDGIYINGGTNYVILDNRITSATRGFYMAGSGKYMNNMTQNVGAPYLGGTAAGATNF